MATGQQLGFAAKTPVPVLRQQTGAGKAAELPAQTAGDYSCQLTRVQSVNGKAADRLLSGEQLPQLSGRVGKVPLRSTELIGLDGILARETGPLRLIGKGPDPYQLSRVCC